MHHPISRIALALVLSLASLACTKDKPLPDDPAAETSAPTQPTQPTKPPAPESPAPRAAPTATADADGYVHDATSVPGKFKTKIGGPVRLLELTLYPGYVITQIQDPKKKENVDAYELRNGEVGDAEPVKFVGKTPTAKDLEGATFDAAAVDFAAVPKMAKDAVAQLKIDDGKVTHMLLKRPRPFGNDVRWRVYVNGARKSGSVEYDPAGHMKKVWN